MREVVDWKLYDTANAIRVVDLGDDTEGSTEWMAGLYWEPSMSEWFLAGFGRSESPMAIETEEGEKSNFAGIKPLSQRQAEDFVDQFGDDEARRELNEFLANGRKD
jgi:hypothetical protein